ncbi:MAG: NAD(P)H-binding protein [Vicinamibacterales bacterium]|nr:NAD(P)H-binding protein [Vicinamibacterales bacterium]
MTWLLVFVLYAVALSAALSRAGFRAGGPTPAQASAAAPARPARVLIVGATGGTGRQLLEQARHPLLSVVKGDVLDAAGVEAAVRGQEAVLSALGHKRFFQPTRILSRGTVNILRAMEAHGVGRLVCETSLGVGDSAWRMGLYYTCIVIPLVLPFYFWDKTRQERAIAGSRVNWTLVRPAVLTDGARRGRLRHGRRVGHLLLTRRVSRADVAAFMLDQLETTAYSHAAPGVAW